MRILVRIFLGVAALACLALPPAALAQTWPGKPVRLVVPFPPGSALDLLARMIGQQMSGALGQPVVVENRVGANGMIGSELVARSAPDGYTIQIATSSTHVTSIFLSKNLPYDPVKDFTPITAAVEPATCIVVHPSVPVNSVRELIEYARRNPGKLTYGSSGIGSVFHMTGELFKQTTGVDIVHVPYKGVAPATTDLVSGQISMMFNSVGDSQAGVRAGKVKMLAVLEPQRFPRLPEVPSIVESIPGFRKPATWFGFFGPAGLPQPIVARMNAEMVKAVHSPEVRAKFEDMGFTIIGNTPDQFADLIRNGIEVFGRIVKAAGIQPE